MIDNTTPVPAQAATDVLRGDRDALGGRTQIGAHIGLIPYLDQRIRILSRHGQDAAWTVIFEGSRQNPFAIRGQRTGDGIAGMGRYATPLEGKADMSAAVDTATPAIAKSVHHAALMDSSAVCLRPIPSDRYAGFRR